MQLESLDVFRTVARYGSITAAARTLGYTQSAVSRQIATLEAQTSTRLFDRQARGVALTDEGRCLLPHAEAILDRLATARRDLDALRGLGGGQLRVGAFPTALAALVPWALAAFGQAHPEVTLSLVEGRTPALLERLRAGDADVAVVSAPPGQPIDATRFSVHRRLGHGRGHLDAGQPSARFQPAYRHRHGRLDRQARLRRRRPRRRAHPGAGGAGGARRRHAAATAHRRRTRAADLRGDRRPAQPSSGDCPVAHPPRRRRPAPQPPLATDSAHPNPQTRSRLSHHRPPNRPQAPTAAHPP